MTVNELFYGVDLPIWEDQPQYKATVQQLLPSSLNLNKTYVPKYNVSPLDGRGYPLKVEPQAFAGVCVVASNRNASMISTAASNGYWSDPSVEEMYGTVRAIERADPTAQPTKQGVHPSCVARAMVGKGWVIKSKYPSADLRTYSAKLAQDWENTPPPVLPRTVKNRDVFKITTLDGIARSIMARRAVVFQADWAWTRTDMFGRIQPYNPGGWHSMAIFGFANNYDKNLPGLWLMLMNSFSLSIMSGGDHPICSGRGTGLYSFTPLDVIRAITSGCCTSVGPLVKV